MMQATPASAQNEDFERFRLHSRREIISLLKTLARRKQLIRMRVYGSDEAATTTVLAVDEAGNMLLVDGARMDSMNARIAAGGQLAFECMLDNIRILFTCASARECLYDDLPAFAMALPGSLIRLQRREHYRVPTPVSNPVRCEIQIPDAPDGFRVFSFPLQNVSGGGIAIVDEQMQIDATIGRVYQDCRIDLPGGSLVIATLEIRNCHEAKLANGKTIRRIGCLFVDLPNPMLSAVQRYITKLEREQNARNLGLA